MPKVSVLLLTLSTKQYSSTAKALKGVRAFFQHPPKVATEFLVLDNGSTDDSPEQFRKAFGERIRVLELGSNLGFQKGMNRGIAATTGEYILLHNPDIEVSRDMVDTLATYLDTHPDVAVAGAKLVESNGRIQDSYRTFMHPQDFFIKRLRFLHKLPYFKQRMIRYLMWDMDHEKEQDVDWFLGACIMIRRSMFEQIGFFDERFFLFVGDTDICKSFWEKGWKVMYLPNAVATHGENRVSGKGFIKPLFNRIAWIHFMDILKYFWKWRGNWDRGPRSRKKKA